MTQFIDLVGRKFGFLTVVSRAESTKSGDSRFTVRCDCGRGKVVLSRSLIKGVTISCGCKLGSSRKGRVRSLLPFGEVAKNRMFARYKISAKDRGYDWGLTREQFKSLIVENCHYCGGRPITRHAKRKYEKVDDIYECNGVDRVDNTKGYFIENVVPCCKFCQYGKRDSTYSDFMDYLDRVSEYHKPTISCSDGGTL